MNASTAGKVAALAAAMAMLIPEPATVQAQTKKISFALTDLGLLPSDTPYSQANEISNPSLKEQAQVAGTSKVDNGARRAVIWELVNEQWIIINLGTLGEPLLTEQQLKDFHQQVLEQCDEVDC